MKNLVVIYIILSLAQVIFPEPIQSEMCTSAKESNVLSDVTQVRIDPCPFPGDGHFDNPCVLQRGTVAQISADFIPNQPIPRMRASLAYVSTFSDLLFPGLESDGCRSLISQDEDSEGVKCPLTPDTQYTWSTNITLSTLFPRNVYPLKLKLTDARFPTPTVIFCQLFSIQLV